ncbi:class II aldolase/adducin family protein [Azospirillum canadense]|uniref:class II aldolase/adducin family protein n=1 Tax=Azospirillum canadense TaxID=403962 RepID=UPI0022267842|nr:class II aldolase/adducin family protein [Azospirillum canadense]MCW2236842.1 ribulose-5-phosphate 4-epimerase/fuculose-1-phosphate aldolase [Azospirillum canadense]
MSTNPPTSPQSFVHAAGRVAGTGIGDAERRARVDLAACYRLVAERGWGDLIYTHISLAVPGEPGRFLINPFGLTFDEVTASNLVKIDIQGNIVGDTPYAVNATGFTIHGAVHAAREDAACVMHLHNEAAVAVSMLKDGLLPLSQHALRFYRDLGYHRYEGLALTEAEKARLVDSLGQRKALLLHNHGSLVLGRTVAEAFCLMDMLDKACRMQLAAQATGAELVLPSPEVCEATYRQLTADPEPEGELEWPALLRRLDRLCPDYKN